MNKMIVSNLLHRPIQPVEGRVSACRRRRRQVAARQHTDQPPVAVEDGEPVGYATFHANGRVSFPWCHPGHQRHAEPLFGAVLEEMRRRGQPTAFAAYRADWPAPRDVFLGRRLRAAPGSAPCGGAVAVGRPLWEAARGEGLDPHARAHLGAVDTALAAARSVLREAAAAADRGPDPATSDPPSMQLAQRHALRVRTVVEAAATQTIERVGRAARLAGRSAISSCWAVPKANSLHPDLVAAAAALGDQAGDGQFEA